MEVRNFSPVTRVALLLFALMLNAGQKCIGLLLEYATPTVGCSIALLNV